MHVDCRACKFVWSVRVRASSRVQDTADRSASLWCSTSVRPRFPEDMNHLAYDDEDEDLTVVITSDAETTFCETKVNSVLIKTLSPW